MLPYIFFLSIIRNLIDLNTFLARVLCVSPALSYHFNQLFKHGAIHCFRNNLLRFHSLERFTDLSQLVFRFSYSIVVLVLRLTGQFFFIYIFFIKDILNVKNTNKSIQVNIQPNISISKKNI